MSKFRQIKFQLVMQIYLIARTCIAEYTYKCDYFDTIALTDNSRLPNGSYLYEDVMIPPELIAEYDYEILFGGERNTVAKHTRGCVCQIKPCIRFCCHPQQVLTFNRRECNSESINKLSYSPHVNITLPDDTVVQRNIFEDFVIQRDLPIPCVAHYALNPQKYPDDTWILFENGTLLRQYDDHHLSKRDYCIQPEKIENIFKPLAHNCATRDEMSWDQNFMHYVMVVSIICLVLTAVVYMSLPKLKNLHGKCFICYLICLAVGYVMLIMDLWEISEDFCSTAGYIGYFAIMAAFLWLCIISCDLWNCFRGTNYNIHRYAPKNRFLIYNVSVWSIASLLLAVVLIADYLATPDTPDHLIPGIGLYSCWIKTHDWSAMVYFHGPMFVLILFNLTMFILTAMRIYEVKKELRNFDTRKDRQEHLNSDKQTFSLFLRLFVIMGVTWVFEIFSYLSSNNETLKLVFKAADLLNSAQGIIIFVFFVCKRSVYNLVVERIRGQELPEDGYGSMEEVSLQEQIDGPNNLI